MQRNIILLYFIIILTIAAIAGYTGVIHDLPAQASVEKGEKVVALQFEAVPAKELVMAKPEVGWVRARSYQYVGIEGLRTVTIHLYAIPAKGKTIDKSEVHAFLEDSGEFYDIGIVGGAGAKNIYVEPVESEQDGPKLVQILGGSSSVSDEIWYIGYDEEKGVWVNLLNMGTPLFADLDGNGKKDLAAISPAGMNPYVIVYRWKDGCFEKADIAAQLGCDYASLVTRTVDKQDMWLVQTSFANNEKTKRYYAYQAGSLLLQENLRQ